MTKAFCSGGRPAACQARRRQPAAGSRGSAGWGASVPSLAWPSGCAHLSTTPTCTCLRSRIQRVGLVCRLQPAAGDGGWQLEGLPVWRQRSVAKVNGVSPKRGVRRGRTSWRCVSSGYASFQRPHLRSQRAPPSTTRQRGPPRSHCPRYLPPPGPGATGTRCVRAHQTMTCVPSCRRRLTERRPPMPACLSWRPPQTGPWSRLAAEATGCLGRKPRRQQRQPPAQRRLLRLLGVRRRVLGLADLQRPSSRRAAPRRAALSFSRVLPHRPTLSLLLYAVQVPPLPSECPEQPAHLLISCPVCMPLHNAHHVSAMCARYHAELSAPQPLAQKRRAAHAGHPG